MNMFKLYGNVMIERLNTWFPPGRIQTSWRPSTKLSALLLSLLMCFLMRSVCFVKPVLHLFRSSIHTVKDDDEPDLQRPHHQDQHPDLPGWKLWQPSDRGTAWHGLCAWSTVQAELHQWGQCCPNPRLTSEMGRIASTAMVVRNYWAHIENWL